jgi:hypothetical protein
VDGPLQPYGPPRPITGIVLPFIFLHRSIKRRYYHTKRHGLNDLVLPVTATEISLLYVTNMNLFQISTGFSTLY